MNDMSNMKYRFEKFSRNNVLLSILMVILGLLLILWPGKTLEVAAKLLGIALLVGAAISCFSWYRDRNLPNRSYTTLAIGMLCLVAGLVDSALYIGSALSGPVSGFVRDRMGNWGGVYVMWLIVSLACFALAALSSRQMKTWSQKQTSAESDE